MSILYSEYESPIYSSLHLGKMHVFGICGIFKTDIMKKHDFFIYFLVTWCAIMRTRIKSLTNVIQRSGKFPLSECNSI